MSIIGTSPKKAVYTDLAGRPRIPPKPFSGEGGSLIPGRKNRNYRVIGSKKEMQNKLLGQNKGGKQELSMKPHPPLTASGASGSGITVANGPTSFRARQLLKKSPKKPINFQSSTKLRTRNKVESARVSVHSNQPGTKPADSQPGTAAQFHPREYLSSRVSSASKLKLRSRLIKGQDGSAHIQLLHPEKKYQTVDTNPPEVIVKTGWQNEESKNPEHRETIRSPINQNPIKNIQRVQSQNLVKTLEKPSDTLHSSQVLINYSHHLSEYEKGEILDYREIYYFNQSKSQQGDREVDPSKNHGFDDSEGYYIYKTHEHIAYRYEILELLGKGSFGLVFKCKDHKTDGIVALKMIKNKKRFHQQAIVEVRVLDAIRKTGKDGVTYIVEMLDYFTFRNHICLTFELLSITLFDFMQLNSFSGFSLSLIRKFAIQILFALSLTHQLNVVHCDLKPENILLKNPTRSGIKIIDYGSSTFENEQVYTYIQSRFYRAPEIIFGIPYTCGIDMWSFGCLLFELYTGSPLFPSESEADLLQHIMEVKGLPPRELLLKGSRYQMFFDGELRPRVPPHSKGRLRKSGSKDIAKLLGTSDRTFQDLILRCLEYDPFLRITADQALNHEWIVDGIKNIISK